MPDQLRSTTLAIQPTWASASIFNGNRLDALLPIH